MARYPDTPKTYPVTPKAYPVAPKAYPTTGNIHAFPTGIVPIDISQSVQFQAIASSIVPISISQSISATFVASKGLIAAQLDIDPSKNITLSGTMRATGTTPPVVLLKAGTGSLTFATGCPGFWVDILAGGATFDLSFDNGASVSFPAQTIPVGGGDYTIPSGTYAGMILTFPLGTYNADNLYEGAVASVTSADSGAYVFSQSTTATQPVYRVSVGSGAYFFFQAAQTLECSTAGVVNLFVNDPAMTFMMKFAPTTALLGEDMFTITQTGGTNGSHRFGKNTAVTGRLTHVIVNDGGISTNSNQTRAVNDLFDGTITKYCWYGPGSNGGTNCKVNDANLNPNAGTWNPGTVTPTRATLGATHDNTFKRQFTGKIYRVVAFSTQLSASDQTAWNAAL